MDVCTKCNGSRWSSCLDSSVQSDGLTYIPVLRAKLRAWLKEETNRRVKVFVYSSRCAFLGLFFFWVYMCPGCFLLLSDAKSWISCSGWFMWVKSTVSISPIFSRNQCLHALTLILVLWNAEQSGGQTIEALSRKWRQREREVRRKDEGVGQINEYLNLSELFSGFSALLFHFVVFIL